MKEIIEPKKVPIRQIANSCVIPDECTELLRQFGEIGVNCQPIKHGASKIPAVDAIYSRANPYWGMLENAFDEDQQITPAFLWGWRPLDQNGLSDAEINTLLMLSNVDFPNQSNPTVILCGTDAHREHNLPGLSKSNSKMNSEFIAYDDAVRTQATALGLTVVDMKDIYQQLGYSVADIHSFGSEVLGESNINSAFMHQLTLQAGVLIKRYPTCFEPYQFRPSGFNYTKAIDYVSLRLGEGYAVLPNTRNLFSGVPLFIHLTDSLAEGGFELGLYPLSINSLDNNGNPTATTPWGASRNSQLNR